ncbi:flagellar biosynthesis protein FlaG [Iocasia frigidifontis]|uniref:Flagellar biosynthesis protein FlaG n=1 Tax=Iocasia fonsfrigidae TaxID=2682810 RepID=A0A8A7KLN7_9FIRM|nr:flagellar protein FlaG [Iocasia fonsfrigidae]QTL98752.1 flagellar biosynthesis protein FlaG [Iocasia fonsfrigidae]
MYLDSIAAGHNMTKQLDTNLSDLNLLDNPEIKDSNKLSYSENNSGNEECEEGNKSGLKTVIESANEGVQVFNKSIEFTIHEETNKIMVKIIDNETDEVIKEIPSEKILNMVAKFCEIAGILLDEKV